MVRKITNKLLILTLFVSCLMPIQVHGEADQPFQMAALSEDAILFQEIPSIYTASKYEQKVTEAPSSVSIVTAEEISKYGYRTLADLLGSIRGFYTTYDRNYNYLGIRGFGPPGDFNSRVLLLVDGHRLNDANYYTASIGTEFVLDVDLIDRVEVVRGPSSSLYGTNAFFGVINVITRNGRQLKGAELSGEAGTFDTYKGRLSYGDKFQNGMEMLLSGSYYDSDGDDELFYNEFNNPNDNYGVVVDSDDDRYYSLFGKVSYHDLTLQGAYVERDKDIPTAPWDTEFNFDKTDTKDIQTYLDLKYEHYYADKFGVLARLFWDRYDDYGDYLYDYADPGDPPYLVVNKDVTYGRWWGTELQLSKTLFDKHKAIIGAEYRDNYKQDQKNLDEEIYLIDHRSSTNWAVFVQDEFMIFKDLTLNAGVRYDDYDSFGDTTNPRIALVYDPFEKTTFKLLYGEAFRAPNTYELYYHDGFETQKPNPDLDAENIKTYELVCEQYFGERIRWTAGGFYYEIDDLISQELDPADDLLFFNNVEDVKAKGVELELEGKWENGWTGRVSYTYQETEDEERDKPLPNSPKHLAKVNVIMPLIGKHLFLGLEEQYTSKRKTVWREDANGFLTIRENINGFFVTNLTLFNQHLIKGLDLSASVYNLFDKGYSDPGGGEHLQNQIKQDGRVFRFKLTYAF